jgi:hypothetical protein
MLVSEFCIPALLSKPIQFDIIAYANWLLIAGTESINGQLHVDSDRHYSSYAGHIDQLVN